MQILTRQVDVREVVVNVSVPKRIKAQIQSDIDAGKCIIKGCDKESVARGLCWTCRRASRAAIAEGKATEEGLMQAGMLLPPRKVGRKPSNAFIKQLEA